MDENSGNNESQPRAFREQFTVRGVIIGIIGCVVITVSSIYVALRMGALPWPIIFVALVSMFALKLFRRRKTNLNEINVTHTIMSAGAMVAGGVAFTIPGVWILDPDAEVSFWPLLVATLGGVLLGLISIAMYRKHFIEEEEETLVFPMGQAAAETLKAGDRGGKKAGILFGSMGFAAVFAALRDALGKIPAMVLSKFSPVGVSFGIYVSPMMMSVGYLLGPVLIAVWFVGALIGNYGIVVGGVAAGWFDLETATNIKSSLGMGVMVGVGIGIVIKHIIPRAKAIFGSMFFKENKGDAIVNLRWVPIVVVILAVVFTFVLDLGIVASIIVIIGAWIAAAMSAQVVGQTGIDPMEVFGVIVLLCAKVATDAGHLDLFLVAAVVAVACGLVGDVMNDFKVGQIVKSDPKAQWYGEAIGAIIGAFVAVAVFLVLLNAYGPEAFGAGQTFVAAQASVVAAMVGGIPHMPAFIIGLIIGAVLYCLNFPVMSLGLGIYLPFYMSFTAAIGGLIRVILDKVFPKLKESNNGLVVASGLLGGEAVVSVIIALVLVVQGSGALF